MTTALPRTRVITQHRFGGPEVLEVEERERPVAGPGEVLLRVRAAGVNAVDRLVRSGTAPLFGEPPFVLGNDVSGVVEAAGAGVTRFRPGDEVFGKVLGGGYAEYVAAPADQFAAKPSTLDHVHAAAAPTATLTAWQALVDLAQVGPGTRVLVHAAGGGVGHAGRCRSPRRRVRTSSVRPAPTSTSSCATWAWTSRSTTRPRTSPRPYGTWTSPST
ncbi:alcohol dehydrogenase catalytic domain-containing protein [Streptomyces sp. ActVer]|uniref:quinone oxidoreductase family protein n=1 Tax=Streptomyces sp. ActVer TaxID=3014558 RepID=UPI002F964632